MVALASITVSALGSDFLARGARMVLSASFDSTPSRSRKRKKLLMRATARAPASATSTPSVAPPRHEAAEVGGAHLGQHLNAHRPAGVHAKKRKELLHIAAIGLQRLGREPAHAAEVALPSAHEPACHLIVGEQGGGHEPTYRRSM